MGTSTLILVFTKIKSFHLPLVHTNITLSIALVGLLETFVIKMRSYLKADESISVLFEK